MNRSPEQQAVIDAILVRHRTAGNYAVTAWYAGDIVGYRVGCAAMDVAEDDLDAILNNERNPAGTVETGVQ